MNEDNYKIVLLLSHRRISYEYWQKSSGSIKPFTSSNWPAPLAFYCSPTGITIGEEAEKAALLGTANAFNNYFERLNKNETYTWGGQEKPITNLLLDASETEFRDFYSNILYNQYGSLNENRANMPLVIVCEADLESQERAYITDLFKRSGYSRINVFDYDSYLEQYVKDFLTKEYTFNNVLVAWTEGLDLVLTLFEITSQHPKKQLKLKGLGKDPRLDYVKDLIWEDILGSNQFINRTSEDAAITKAASDFLNGSTAMINSQILLSDGMQYHYSLNRLEIESLIHSDESSLNLRKQLESFLYESNITNRSQTLLILRGVAAGNSYFEQNLSGGFSRVIRSDNNLRDKVLNLVIQTPNPAVQQSITPQSITSQPVTPQSVAPQSITPLSVTPSDDLKREWREIRAVYKGKIRIGKYTEAKELCEKFLQKNAEEIGSDELVKDIKIAIEHIVNLERQCNKKEDVKKSTKVRTTVPRVNITNKPKPIDKGLELIHQNKVKEARDWYRENGNREKSRLLSDIIRSQKGIDMRKREIDGYRKNKNTEQIGRIIKEIEDFIDLCEKVSLPIAEYKKLLTDYKKI